MDRIDGLLRDYYKDEIGELAEKYPSEQRSLTIEYPDIRRVDDDLADDYLTDPEQVTEWLEEGLRNFDLPVDISLDGATVQVVDLPDTMTRDVGHWRPNDVMGELVPVKGQVSKRGDRDVKDKAVVFECQRCGSTTTIPQSGDSLQEPHECSGCERQGPFIEAHDHPNMRSVDYQQLRIQELPEEAGAGGGNEFDVELTGDMVGTAKPGDRVVVNTKVKSRRKSGQGNSNSLLRELYGEAVSVEKTETDHEDVEIGPYRERIEEIAAGDPFEALKGSIVPTHMGDERIKMAVAFQLFGGVSSELPDGTAKSGNIHLLLMGEPGTGKSSFLDYVSDVVPRAVKATGKGSSAAGLTAAAVQSDFGGGGWTLEAGALVEANGGVAAIDELDKMEPGDRDGMLEAMSNQRVTISKAGKNRELPADTTVLSAANPEHGTFHRHEALDEQIDLSPVLMSRFDLLFIVSDDPDEDRDRDIADHVNKTTKAGQQKAAGEKPDEDAAEAAKPTIAPDVLRAYIAAGKQVYPVMTDEAADHMAEDYVDLRNANDEEGPKPATVRALMAVTRLSEASARIRLSDEITVEDVERAIKLHRTYMAQFGLDEDGKFDANIVETGKSTTQHDRIQSVKDAIRKNDPGNMDGAPESEVLDTAEAAGMTRSKAEHELGKLRRQGEIYEPATEHYRVSE